MDAATYSFEHIHHCINVLMKGDLGEYTGVHVGFMPCVEV